jgi:hypothetical protein
MPRKLVLLNMMPMMFCTLPMLAYGFGRLPALQRARKHTAQVWCGVVVAAAMMV